MTNVMLIEDDVEIARIIRYFLGMEECYHVVWADSAAQARALARDQFDIILLDVLLPDGNGIDLCSELRKWHNCPLLFISCVDDNDTIISALERGGDDYIVKPFDNKVLHAKIQAALRRVSMDHNEFQPEALECGGLSLLPGEHSVLAGGEKKLLTQMEFKLLRFLMQHPKQCYKLAELYRLLWGGPSYGDTRTVATHMRSLRKKIESDPNHPRYLKSIWGKGYVFDPDDSL